MAEDTRRLLVIRRDNIGDLLCTTPLLTALRKRFPAAQISVLVNDYNAPVLQGNPDLDRIYSYTKAKHSKLPRWLAWWKEWQTYRALRRSRFDLVIHANPMPHPRTARLVRYVGGARRLGVIDAEDPLQRQAYNLALSPEDVRGTHHVERVFSLLRPLGIEGPPGPMTLKAPAPVPDTDRPGPSIGLHISSRKPCNRWPESAATQLLRSLVREQRQVDLFWAPGSRANQQHPGDDETAAAITARFAGAVIPRPTRTLGELIAGIAGVDLMVCADGGALHIAAALGKPVIGLYGCTDPSIWGPWKVPSRALRGDGDSAAIRVDAVLAAVGELSSP